MAVLLSAIKTHGIYQISNVEQSPFKMWDQFKKKNHTERWNTIAKGKKILITCKMKARYL